MSNAPASDCGTLSCLFSADDVFTATMMSSAKASGNMAANCIAPDLCEKKCCLSSYAGCGLHFLHIRWKKIHVSSTSQQSKWLRVCSRDYHEVTYCQLLRTRLTFSKSLMVSVAVSKLGCSDLVFVAATTMMNCCQDYCQRSAGPHLLFSNRCVFVDFFHAFLCTFSCVFVINRNAFLWSVNALSQNCHWLIYTLLPSFALLPLRQLGFLVVYVLLYPTRT